ncbi:hypothetical protein LTR37_013870 [Vermiconidia calcicola]|uniref:Uncharacterized protein n=1 Tax=Vermiconidia calcicola TaxID=1690605 RepID=A0ACC3MWP0_9PEZI|nr:hypothetical protein LTR37_013870 [Vermiconidia calcicola]
MDVSAFETYTDDEVTLQELYDRLPHSMKAVVEVGSSLFKGYCMIVLSAVACAASLSLIVGWICLFWLLTHLLLKVAALLRICYDQPKTSGDHNDYNAASGRGSPGSGNAHAVADNRYAWFYATTTTTDDGEGTQRD